MKTGTLEQGETGIKWEHKPGGTGTVGSGTGGLVQGRRGVKE